MSRRAPLSSHGVFNRSRDGFGVIERIRLHKVLETHLRTQLTYLLVVRQHRTVAADGKGEYSGMQPHGD